MCGIAGIYNFKRGPLRKQFVQQCLTTMLHRGPDSQCTWDNEKNYITGFCRLAIRDLSANGNQPMLSGCGNYCITFNGEIYNTGVLQQLLRPYKTHFISTSDTEVLLYSLMHLGIKKTLQIADGIFALAFYDIQKNSLVLARDRVGIKPLYMGYSAEGVVYSSQYDHVINHPFFKAESINAGAIGSFLSLGYIPENLGAVNKTSLLLHGHYYVIENEKAEAYKYYSYPVEPGPLHTKDIDEVLAKAVQDQLVSDVPLGTFMSGGVDSTLVTYFANRHTPVNSFTIGVRNHKMDESEAAQQFADIFKTQHHSRFIAPADLLGLINENTRAFSEPFADFSSLPTLMLSKFAREKVTVALSGDGGDELFWGYPRNAKALQNETLYKKTGAARKTNLLKAKLFNRSSVDVGRHWHEDDFITYYYHTLFIHGALGWLPKVFKPGALADGYYTTMLQQEGPVIPTTDRAMNIVRKLETDIHLQRILLKVDRASMFHSLEVRVPLLSNDVLDASNNFSYKECIRNGKGKMVLKESLIKKTNEQLVMQPKKGFVIPMAEWMRNELKNDVTGKLLDMPAHLSGMFNKKELENLLHGHMTGKNDWSWFIWAIYSLVNWDAQHRNNKILSV